MFYWLIEISNNLPPGFGALRTLLNVFRYITFRTGGAVVTGALEADVIAAIRPGDAVMVKGSLGSRMGPIVKALERQYSRRDAAAARVQG